MTEWPYALPNLMSAIFLTISTIAVFLGLEETHEALRHRPDLGRTIGAWIWRTVFRRTDRQSYSAIPNAAAEVDTPEGIEMQSGTKKEPARPKPRRKLPFRRIWTRNVIITLTAHGLSPAEQAEDEAFATRRYSPRRTASSKQAQQPTTKSTV